MEFGVWSLAFGVWCYDLQFGIWRLGKCLSNLKNVKVMSINIRQAKRDDCKRIFELVNELALYEKAPDEVTVSLEHFIDSGFGSKPVWWALVATSPSNSLSKEERKYAYESRMKSSFTDAKNSETIIGFALYYIRFSTWKGQRMYLEDLLVTEKMRGKGVGKLLFDELIEEAKRKKLAGIAWQVLDWNEPGINFYKKYNAAFDGGWLNCSVAV